MKRQYTVGVSRTRKDVVFTRLAKDKLKLAEIVKTCIKSTLNDGLSDRMLEHVQRDLNGSIRHDDRTTVSLILDDQWVSSIATDHMEDLGANFHSFVRASMEAYLAGDIANVDFEGLPTDGLTYEKKARNLGYDPSKYRPRLTEQYWNKANNVGYYKDLENNNDD